MIMGMPISIDIPNISDNSLFQEIFDFLGTVNERFSPYKATSEVSLFRDEKLKTSELSPDLTYIISQCKTYEKTTNGYFSAYYKKSFDPSGYVKAWAIHQIYTLLINREISTFLINIAGDMVANGDTKSWTIGIEDPFDTHKLLGKVSLTNQAIATSGSYIRGEHIYDPHTKTAQSDLVSVSIYGEDIIQADIFATACIAMGFEKAKFFLQNYPQYAALLIKKDGEIVKVNSYTLH